MREGAGRPVDVLRAVHVLQGRVMSFMLEGEVLQVLDVDVADSRDDLESDEMSDAVLNGSTCRQHQHVDELVVQTRNKLESARQQRHSDRNELLRVVVDVLDLGDGFLDMHDQVKMHEQASHELGHVDGQTVDFEFVVSGEDDCLVEDQGQDDDLEQEAPQGRVEVAGALVRVQVILLGVFDHVAQEANGVQILDEGGFNVVTVPGVMGGELKHGVRVDGFPGLAREVDGLPQLFFSENLSLSDFLFNPLAHQFAKPSGWKHYVFDSFVVFHGLFLRVGVRDYLIIMNMRSSRSC